MPRTRLAFAALALVLATTGPAAAQQDDSTWIFNPSEEGSPPTLMLGVPDSDAIDLIFNCDKRARTIDLSIFNATKRIGAKETVVLSAGGSSATLKAQIVADEMVESLTIAEQQPAGPILEVLRAATADAKGLGLKLGNQKPAHWPTEAGKPQIEAFVDACAATSTS